MGLERGWPNNDVIRGFSGMWWFPGVSECKWWQHCTAIVEYFPLCANTRNGWTIPYLSN